MKRTLGKSLTIAVLLLSGQGQAEPETAQATPAPGDEPAAIVPGINLEGILEPGEDGTEGALGTGGLDFQEQEDPILVPADVASYQFYITDLESRGGAYAHGISEQLLGLGSAYHEQGLYQEAVKAFKRAVHLERINSGLYSSAQIPALQKLISSHVAAGEYAEADERQYYLYRVQRRVYQGDQGAMSMAILERAHWEKQAYYLSVGDASFVRLLTMWELYGTALSSISQSEGEYSRSLVKPLQGLLQTQYLIAQYQGESTPTFQINGGGPEGGSLAENRFAMLRNSNYRQGLGVIAALRKVYDHNEGEGSLQSSLTSIEQGDWEMWYKKFQQAHTSYRLAWQEMIELDEGQALVDEHFGRPVMLPATPEAHVDLQPPPEITGYAIVRYGVNQNGRVYGLKMVEKQLVSENVDKSTVRLMRALKGKSFRPRLENGEPVATEEIVEQYAF